MTNIEKFNPFEDAMQFVQGKNTDIAKGKFCEAVGGIPIIGPAICSDSQETTPKDSDNENNDTSPDNIDGEDDNILKGTPFEEPNNKMKEQLIGTPLEDLGFEPIFLIAGISGIFFILMIIIILIIGIGLLYYFYEPSIDTDGILKQYEFPIPPPPPPPPVNFVMSNDITNN